MSDNHPMTDCGRKICSKEHPMPVGALGRWMHGDAIQVGDQSDGFHTGDMIDMHCPTCGKTWEQELPQ